MNIVMYYFLLILVSGSVLTTAVGACTLGMIHLVHPEEERSLGYVSVAITEIFTGLVIAWSFIIILMRFL